MRSLVAIVVFASACAAGPSPIRAIDGRPLPTYSRVDSELQPYKLRCPGLGTFLIVEPPHEAVAGSRTQRDVPRSMRGVRASMLCAQIASADED